MECVCAVYVDQLLLDKNCGTTMQGLSVKAGAALAAVALFASPMSITTPGMVY